ncbi:MAG TPA: DUF1648 domain-containing protein [Longimicrobiales bacterium]|nr:DUF1648 domain-containing protein [Longimicrobiales bacterium]
MPGDEAGAGQRGAGPLEGVVLRRLALPWLGPLLAVATAVMGWALLDRLPERVPIHWGVDGRADGWMSPLSAVAWMPVFILALWAFLLGVGRITPGMPRGGAAWRAYLLLCNAVLLFMAVLQAAVLASAAGAPVDPGRWAIPLIGVLFVMIGALAPHLPQGGINLPLGDDPEYRASVSRFLGRTFVIGGIAVFLVGVLLPPREGTWVGFILIMAVSLLPLAYLGLRPPPTRRPPGGWRKGFPDKEERDV